MCRYSRKISMKVARFQKCKIINKIVTFFLSKGLLVRVQISSKGVPPSDCFCSRFTFKLFHANYIFGYLYTMKY